MSSNFNKLASELKNLMSESDARKPKAYDTQAEVLRVEKDIVWVHIPGGVDETPVRKTIDAKKGDKVRVHVAKGSAYLVGNTTNPPTDDAKANEAYLLGDEAFAEAGRAKEAADSAQEAAGQAWAYADSAHQAADAAWDYADDAHDAAVRATGYANDSLSQLGVVEDVVGTLNWITTHATYKATDDTEVHAGKWYFTKSGDSYNVVIAPTGNPKEKGYYEIDSIDEAVSAYVASHLALTDAGLWVTKDNQGYKILLANDGMRVYDNTGHLVSTFGESIMFDSSRPQKIGNNNSYIEYYDSNNDGTPDAIRVVADSISFASGKGLYDDLDIGARNLARGTATMKKGTGSWDTGTWRDSGASNTYEYPVSDSPVAGVNKGILVTTAVASTSYGVAQDSCPMQSKKLTFSVWAKGTAGGTIRIQSAWWSDIPSSTNFKKNVIATGDWQYITLNTDLTNVSVPNGKCSIAYLYFTGVNVNDTCVFVAPKLEYGNKTTDWSPAPEDLEDYADAAIRVTAEGINSEVKKKVGNDEIISRINQSAEGIRIQASKVAITDSTNYVQLNNYTAATYNWDIVEDVSNPNEPWYQRDSSGSRKPVRDAWVSEWFDCQGEESFRIGISISSNVKGAKTSSSTTSEYLKCGAIINAQNSAGTNTWRVWTPYTSSASAPEEYYEEVLKLPSDAVRFRVGAHIEGFPNAVAMIGTFKIRKFTCFKMANANLIVDGAVTADKLDANSLVIGKMPQSTQEQILNSNIDIGGKNILRGSANPLTRATLWKYHAWYQTGGGGSVEWNVRLPNPPIPEITNGVKATINTANTAIGIAQACVPLRKGTVTLSCWVKATAGDVVNLQAVWSNSTSAPEGGSKTYTVADSNWHRYEHTYNVKYDHTELDSNDKTSDFANAGYARVQSATTGRVAYICGIKLEYGNKATEWTASPDDFIDDADNMLLDWDVPSLTRVKASSNRYWSYASVTTITPSFQNLLEPPEEGIKYMQRYVATTATDARYKELAFYSTENLTNLPFKLNVPYTISFWARCTSGSGQARTAVHGASPNVELYTLTTEWKRFTRTFTMTTQPSYYRIWIGCYFPANATGTVEVCGCRLVAGIDGDEAAKTATSYITRITDAGIKIHAANNVDSNYAQIDASGMDIYMGGNSVAKYGSASRIGKGTSYNLYINTNGLLMRNGTTVIGRFVKDTSKSRTATETLSKTLSSGGSYMSSGLASATGAIRVHCTSVKSNGSRTSWYVSFTKGSAATGTSSGLSYDGDATFSNKTSSGYTSIVLNWVRYSLAEATSQLILGTETDYSSKALVIGQANSAPLFQVDYNGDTTVGGNIHAANIGNTNISGTTGQPALGVSVPSGTTTAVDSFTLEPGIWLVAWTMTFSSNATGIRVGNVQRTQAGTWRYASTNALSSGSTGISATQIMVPTSSATYYVNAYQNSGSTLTVNSEVFLTQIG